MAYRGAVGVIRGIVIVCSFMLPQFTIMTTNIHYPPSWQYIQSHFYIRSLKMSSVLCNQDHAILHEVVDVKWDENLFLLNRVLAEDKII